MCYFVCVRQELDVMVQVSIVTTAVGFNNNKNVSIIDGRFPSNQVAGTSGMKQCLLTCWELWLGEKGIKRNCSILSFLHS